MKILNPGADGATTVSPEAAATDGPGAQPAGAQTEFEHHLATAIAEAKEEVASENGGTSEIEDNSDGIGGVADVAEHVKADPLLELAEEDHDKRFSDAVDDIKVDKAPIEQKHKDAFIESVITGMRYVESFELFHGRFKLKIRARSVRETDALTAYARRMISTGAVKVDYEYSALMRKLLAVAQVEELNGVKNPPLEEPLFFEERENGITPPAWEARLKTWGDKPEVMMIAVTRCILEFEARYWHMIDNVNDENFWLPGESTGE